MTLEDIDHLIKTGVIKPKTCVLCHEQGTTQVVFVPYEKLTKKLNVLRHTDNKHRILLYSMCDDCTHFSNTKRGEKIVTAAVIRYMADEARVQGQVAQAQAQAAQAERICE